MCRLTLQLLGMFGNVLGRLRHALQRPRHMEAWWYTTPLTLRLIRQQVRVGFLFDVGLLGPCRSMPRSAKDLAKHAKDVAKHAEDGRGRCQACLGVAKQAYTS